MNRTKKTTSLCLCALFTSLICIGAFIKLPLSAVPLTLQYEFTVLAGLLLGKKYGTLSVLVYLILGLIGFPVFSKGGGISYVLMPDFGYLIGFLPGTYITGMIARKSSKPGFKRLLAAVFSGMLAVYFFGMLYFYAAKNIWLPGDGIGVGFLFINCFLVPVPGDIIMCVLSAFAAVRLIPLTEKYTS
ncbi:MAG: biotin transporter BioY [Ruminococcus sp.]|nr:biotin transporter BioY [Ruminococcus sp.]